MRSISFTRRWRLKRPAVSPPWVQNPWIGASSKELSDSRMQAEDDSSASKQYKAALSTWEDEGGSIRTGVLLTS